MEEVTEDTLLGGKVHYRQPARGYRVGLEAPLLAAFALLPERRRPRVVADLGAGPGAIGLCLAAQVPKANVYLVEADPWHAELAQYNARSNQWQDRVRVVQGDVAEVEQRLGRGRCDWVLSNPPWFEERKDRAMPIDQRRAASRARSPESLRLFCRAARLLLGRGGRFCITFPASSLELLFGELGALGLVPKRLRMLHARPGEPASVVFVEACAAKPGGLHVEPPWFVRMTSEAYTLEMRALLWGEPSGHSVRRSLSLGLQESDDKVDLPERSG